MAIERVSDLLVAADPTALAQEAAKQILTIAEEAVTRRGSFSVVLAGGSTPQRLYSLLAAEPYCTHLPWSNTHLFWGDERAVPPEHPDSNFGMAKVALLSHVPIPANRVHRMPAERADLDAAAVEYEFLVSGIEKATALQAIFEGPSDPERLPAQLIRPVTGRLVWLADRAAVSRLGDRITVT